MNRAPFGDSQECGDRRARRTQFGHDRRRCAACGFVDERIEGVGDPLDERKAGIGADVDEAEVAFFFAQGHPPETHADEHVHHAFGVFERAGFEQQLQGGVFAHPLLRGRKGRR
jgi:hypothetical protein